MPGKEGFSPPPSSVSEGSTSLPTGEVLHVEFRKRHELPKPPKDSADTLLHESKHLAAGALDPNAHIRKASVAPKTILYMGRKAHILGYVEFDRPSPMAAAAALDDVHGSSADRRGLEAQGYDADALHAKATQQLAANEELVGAYVEAFREKDTLNSGEIYSIRDEVYRKKKENDETQRALVIKKNPDGSEEKHDLIVPNATTIELPSSVIKLEPKKETPPEDNKPEPRQMEPNIWYPPVAANDNEQDISGEGELASGTPDDSSYEARIA